jgi:Protein of unknown function (DUF2817)
MNVSANFSATYAEAREKFIVAAKERDMEVTSHLNEHAKGAEGEDLYMDVVRFGPRAAKKILFISSGTHGGEGFCGSGIQVNLLKNGFFKELPADTAVILVHAVNPSGFSHIRRVNENNIDLNRNFRDFSEELPDNPAYREVHDMVVPTDWDGPAREEAEAKITAFIEDRGLPTFQAAVTGGQHIEEKGLFFGGKEASWSNETLRAISKEHAGDAEHLALLDIHTGLGPYGYGELIFVGDINGLPRAQNWYDNEATSPEAGTSSSAVVSGTINQGICQMAPNATHTCVAIEYGTLPIMEVLNALRADNWLYIHGDIKSELGQKIKNDVRDAFYCDADDWKSMIWERGHSIISKALKGLENA